MTNKNLKTLLDEMERVSEKGSKQQVFTAEVTSNWTQGRACFGGLQGALATRAMRLSLDEDIPLRSLQVSFIGPIAVGGIEILVRILRQGRNVTQVQAEIIQDAKTCCIITACFGVPRMSSIQVESEAFPEGVAGPDGLVDLPYLKGLTPEFTAQYHMRWGIGGVPFTRQKGNSTGIWARQREESEEITSIEDLIMFADLPPTPALSKLAKPAQASSLTWMLEILEDDFVARNDDWWFIHTTVDHYSHGYGQQQYTIYSPDKKAVALGRQVVTVFD
ncbi:acyl-CoA thioesterase [Parendozoicomonas haliclonae]|uniref:Acyl-CoA thioesterase n=1 Tax=Parendozoicomonas haliclonae TaxID=1960125 RepID=A0A1X7AQ64_9GAMM|nr:thioesterase family protein [Parendozoicomonas haliclonae]SMA49538.1 hypothetical protein EHSB41UT_03329 [Parendozoicomonas haliclonae]